jgi:hypothetical protein
LVYVALGIGIWPTVHAQVLAPQSELAETEQLTGKTTKVVLERARAGMEQTVHVSFEWEVKRQKEESQRRAKGLHSNDDEIEAKVQAAIKALRESIFPNGPLGAVTVVWASDYVPTATVLVPSYAALLQLLSHKKVKRVEEFRPAGLA